MIKAIETVYKGYRFRSRLEARWAVFFDELGISYEYEKEGYDLNGTLYLPADFIPDINTLNDESDLVPYKGDWYLPDFWLPEQQFWIEIKGQRPTSKEIDKLVALTGLTETRGFILWGNIPESDETQSTDWEEYQNGSYRDECRQWSVCSICGAVDLTFCGRGDYNAFCKNHTTGKYLHQNITRLNKAFTAARSARFEHL